MDSQIFHYIADTSGKDPSAYIWNGLTGQFKGWYLTEPYNKKIKDYNYKDDREVIYYDLKLSKKQIENLLLHAIELKRTYFNYYFLDENCALFIGKALNSILEQDIISKSNLVFPSQIINNLYKDNKLTKTYKRPSSTALFNTHYNQLTQKEKKAVKHLILNPTTLRTEKIGRAHVWTPVTL